ncbi:MAG: hypothetical protein OQK32_07865 [Gammaproteobacteria bacterium]|nr:hypothetical protein [Gammaproteobacteria bacterium]MCW8923703.1 hypothetical protein [Gammaproteobacteria bacterium]
MDVNNNFEERLKMLLSGRKIHSWGDKIGLTKTILTRMNKGIMPGADKLSPAIRAENLSLSWLIDGIGSPYLVNHCISDEDCYATLDELYIEQWNTYLLLCGQKIAIVLTQPGSYYIKDDPYQYPIVEVLVGEIGSMTLQRIDKATNGKNIFYMDISSEEMKQLAKGQIGTYQLLNSDDAILKNALLIRNLGELEHKRFLKCSEDKSGYNIASDISSDEMATLKNLRKLEPPNLMNIKTLIQALVNKKE